MERLWAPWRMEYLMSDKPDGCIFCEKAAEDNDRKNLILLRSKASFVMMNAYPYNNGHLIIAPYTHAATLAGLGPDERCDLIETLARAERVIERAFRPQGMNMGINLGHCAGAGVPGHVHVHILPRWEGDTNFMPVLGETRVIPELLTQTYERLLEHVEE